MIKVRIIEHLSSSWNAVASTQEALQRAFNEGFLIHRVDPTPKGCLYTMTMTVEHK